MVDGLGMALIVASLAVAALCAVTAVMNRPTGDPHLYAVGAVEVALLVQIIIATVLLIGGDRPEEFATFVGYLLVTPLVLPIGFFLSLVERTRWGSVILGVVCLVVPVLVVRLQDLWSVRG